MPERARLSSVGISDSNVYCYYSGESERATFNVENDTVVHVQKQRYGGSCTNKHDILTDTSVEVLCNARISGFLCI